MNARVQVYDSVQTNKVKVDGVSATMIILRKENETGKVQHDQASV